MCINVIYGPINQPVRHRGNNSAAGKKERALARASENRGTRAEGESSFPGAVILYTLARSFLAFRARIPKARCMISECTLAAFITFARTSPRDV